MSHYYPIKIGGSVIQLPSVTTQIMELNRKGLLGDPLIMRGDRDHALVTGTWIHDLIDRIIKGGVIEEGEWFTLPEEVRNGVRAFIRFRDTIKFRPRESEFTVYSLKHLYAGTVDAIGTSGHLVTILDFKSGQMPSWYVDNQLALYFVAYKERYPRRKVSNLWQVNLDKLKGSYSIRKLQTDDAMNIFETFLELRDKAGLV
jgi:hypothetical protein